MCRFAVLIIVLLFPLPLNLESQWRGLRVAPEFRCSEYRRSHYSYPASIELRIAERLGEMACRYTGILFNNLKESDIEHIVSLSEAHDSGMCGASKAEKKSFARDLINLTLSTPKVNRFEKGAKDATDWLPEINRCWFAHTVVEVKRKYGLTVDYRERDALQSVLSNCDQ